MTTKSFHKISFVLAFALLLITACGEGFLEENPLDFFNPQATLTNRQAFETAIVSLHAGVRNGLHQQDGIQANHFAFHPGTDIALSNNDWRDYEVWLTPTRNTVDHFWNWTYREILPRANSIIALADRPQVVWDNEAEKNAIIAEAKFFRAYAHNVLANLYGNAPIVDIFIEEPKLDFVNSSRLEILEFCAADLSFAVQWLPDVASRPGRITKAAANHLLAEVYISLGKYDDAVTSASAVIDGGKYGLMSTRFGAYVNEPGDVYSDLHRTGSHNLPANREAIWVLQIEPLPLPGAGQYRAVRFWNPNFPAIRDPNDQPALQFADSTNRPQGFLRGTYHLYHSIWNEGDSDIRNSRFNIRRVFQYNLPTSAFFGQVVDPATARNIDTLRNYWPFITKAEGKSTFGAFTGFVEKDVYMMRLAETYLLRAEAYLMKGELNNALNDVNMVRARANATPATVDQLNLDYILDERMRELTIEEPRRLTLARTGKLVERVLRYNQFSSNIKPYHRFFPIPQAAIDANIGAVLKQNPGYPGAD